MTRNIGVTFLFEEDLFQTKIPVASAWSKLREQWSVIAKRSSSEFSFFLDEDGEREMPMEGILKDCLSRRSRTLNIYVQQIEYFSVILYGSANTSFQIRVQERTTSVELTEEIRDGLGLRPHQEIRLLSSDLLPIQPDIPIIQQIATSSKIFVDVRVQLVIVHTEALTFHPILTSSDERVVLDLDKKNSCGEMGVPAFRKEIRKEHVTIFASETMTQSESPFRLRNAKNGAIIGSREPLVSFLTVDDLLDGSNILVLKEHQIEIQVRN